MIDNLNLKLEGKLPINREELFILVNSWGREYSISTIDQEIDIEQCKPKECYPLDKLDISQITDLSCIFKHSPFNGNISDWNVSNVTNMSNMFCYSPFNGNLSKWNVSNVRNMEFMFCYSKFNNDSLKDWNVSNVKSMIFLFNGSKFNGDISNWDISKVETMNYMFYFGEFDGDISKWEFNKNIFYNSLFYQNKNFENKYNNGKEIPNNNSKQFLEWFENNRINIANLNITKEEKLDIDDYLDAFNLNNNLKL